MRHYPFILCCALVLTSPLCAIHFGPTPHHGPRLSADEEAYFDEQDDHLYEDELEQD